MTAVRQLHYTSCRHGQGKGSGFQIRACSAGLDEADKAELVRLGLHTPPDAGPPATDPASPEQNPVASSNTPCPPALRVFTLPSGCRAVQRSVYVGCDYSGREGNFFTHSLIFPKNVDRMLLPDPFQLLHWPGWVESAEAAGDTRQPAPLPELPLSEMTSCSNGEWTIRHLADRLQENPALRGQLEVLLGWLSLPDDQRRPLILQDAGPHLVFWLACLWRALPETTTREMAFSTYQGEPTSRFHVVGTTPGTRFDALPPRVFVFCDLLTGEIPNLPPDCKKALAEGQRLVRRLLGQSLDLPALHDELAVLSPAEGLRRLLLLHAARHDVMQTLPPVNAHEPVWHLAPLCGLGLAYAAADPRRLCALLALLPPADGAAWLRAAFGNANGACITTLRAALPLLGRVNPARAQELREALRTPLELPQSPSLGKR